MKNNILLRKRTPSSFVLFLLFIFVIQLSSFYGENRKLLSKLSGILSDASDGSFQSARIASNIETSPQNDSNNNIKASNQNAILMIHYHKTGFVLSRQLRSHAIKHFTQHIQHGMNPELNYTLPADKPWGSLLQPRQFGKRTHCPSHFGLRGGVIDVQESPDLFCGVDELAKILLGDEQYSDVKESERGETKIVHFVRNPYSMALSNYYYHAQIPTLVQNQC